MKTFKQFLDESVEASNSINPLQVFLQFLFKYSSLIHNSFVADFSQNSSLNLLTTSLLT